MDILQKIIGGIMAFITGVGSLLFPAPHVEYTKSPQLIIEYATVSEVDARMNELKAIIARIEKAQNDPKSPMLGADASVFAGVQTFFLSGSGITSSATSIGLSSLTITQTSQELATIDLAGSGGNIYLTIEPGNRTRQEFASCTTVAQSSADATATLSGCTRGLSPISPYTASTSMRFAHSGRSTVIISNGPGFYNNFALKNNEESITESWLFASTSTKLPGYISQPDNLSGSSTAFASVQFAQNLANQGAATATEAVGGIVELATALETASSTNFGANRPTALQARYATDTPQSSCASGYSVGGSGCTVIASLLGKIKQAWIDLTAAFTWTGSHSWTGSNSHYFDAGSKLGIGTTTPYAPFSVVGQIVASYYTATSTATSTLRNIQVTGNATTSKLFVDSCVGCINGYERVSASLGNWNGGSPSQVGGDVNCSSGKKVLGGGWVGFTDIAYGTNNSYPSDADTWSADFYGGNGQTGASGITIYAICAYP